MVWRNLVEKVNDEKNLEADMVRFEKGLKARPKRPWVVIPGRSFHSISETTRQELQGA
jgi:hypothetical protein